MAAGDVVAVLARSARGGADGVDAGEEQKSGVSLTSVRAAVSSGARLGAGGGRGATDCRRVGWRGEVVRSHGRLGLTLGVRAREISCRSG